MYAKNYGPGAAWTPGVVTSLHGAMLYSVQLQDGRIVKKHVDQLRGRTETSPHSHGDEGDEIDVPIRRDVPVVEPERVPHLLHHQRMRPQKNQKQKMITLLSSLCRRRCHLRLHLDVPIVLGRLQFCMDTLSLSCFF